MELSFDQLPQAVSQLATKLDKIEQLLQKQSSQAPEEQDQIINLEQACALLNLAKPTVYGLVSQRKLPFMKQGKKLYFSKRELNAWLREGHKAVKGNITVIVDKSLASSKKKRR